MKASTLMISATILASICSLTAYAVGSDLQITSLRDNATVSGEVIELSGIGADPAGTLEAEVLTNAWYPQDGQARVNADGSWTYSPVHLAGKGTFNNHTIRITQIKNGQRGKSVSVKGIVRRQ